VVILADPVSWNAHKIALFITSSLNKFVQDGHEICFVGDEAFRELSQVDPAADRLLSEAQALDRSDEWFSKKGLSKAEA